jgi:hypothetical protein
MNSSTLRSSDTSVGSLRLRTADELKKLAGVSFVVAFISLLKK